MRSSALGGSGVGFQDVNAIFTNQAGIAKLEKFSGLASVEQRFGLSELSTYSLGVALPSSAGTFGLSVNYFGFEAFNQQKIGLVYARNLLSKLMLGGEINYHNFNVLEYGSVGTMSFELGLQYSILENIIVGAKIANPIEREFVNGEHLATEFDLGFFYQPVEKVGIAVEVEKQLDTKPNLRIGLEYQLIDVLYARVGVASNPNFVSFGLGTQTKNGFKIDFASNYHQILGWSPGLSIAYQGKASKKGKKR